MTGASATALILGVKERASPSVYWALALGAGVVVLLRRAVAPHR